MPIMAGTLHTPGESEQLITKANLGAEGRGACAAASVEASKYEWTSCETSNDGFDIEAGFLWRVS